MAASAPSATTDPATDVGFTRATLNGSVNPNGGFVAYHYEYGLTTSYGTATSNVVLPQGSTTDEPAPQPATGLNPNTTYHFRIVAQDATSGVIARGADESFTTTGGGIGGPSATTGSASNVANTSATLAGTVNRTGQTRPTTSNTATPPPTDRRPRTRTPGRARQTSA